MRLPVLIYGNPILRQRCDPVQSITDELRQFVADMIETMDAENGAGLAAPQVGRPIRLFVLRSYIETPDGKWVLSEPTVYINPKLSSPSRETLIDTEGCLSIPGLRLEVERPAKITVEATDLNGNLFTEEISGYNARVRMHENDHLNGVLFFDRVDPHTRKKIEPLLDALKKKHT